MIIRNKSVLKSMQKILKHKETIKIIQDSCIHPEEAVYYTNHADTGNYDSSDNSYWANYECHECGKCWSGEQGSHRGTKQ